VLPYANSGAAKPGEATCTQVLLNRQLYILGQQIRKVIAWVPDLLLGKAKVDVGEA